MKVLNGMIVESRFLLRRRRRRLFLAAKAGTGKATSRRTEEAPRCRRRPHCGT
jgi:hypothetical protein